jgi:hypothetical protein
VAVEPTGMGAADTGVNGGRPSRDAPGKFASPEWCRSLCPSWKGVRPSFPEEHCRFFTIDENRLSGCGDGPGQRRVVPGAGVGPLAASERVYSAGSIIVMPATVAVSNTGSSAAASSSPMVRSMSFWGCKAPCSMSASMAG